MPGLNKSSIDFRTRAPKNGKYIECPVSLVNSLAACFAYKIWEYPVGDDRSASVVSQPGSANMIVATALVGALALLPSIALAAPADTRGSKHTAFLARCAPNDCPIGLCDPGDCKDQDRNGKSVLNCYSQHLRCSVLYRWATYWNHSLRNHFRASLQCTLGGRNTQPHLLEIRSLLGEHRCESSDLSARRDRGECNTRGKG